MKITAIADQFGRSAVHALVCAITMSIGSAATAQMLWWPEVESGATRLSQGQNEITCAMFNDALKCWGKNPYVGLGDGSMTPRYAPNLIFPDGVTDVATGSSQICAIVHGAPLCWGRNRYGEIGDGSFSERLTPTPVPSILSGATAVGTGIEFTCALINRGVQCWGKNESGQLGNGTLVNSAVPVRVIDTDVSALAVGYNLTCAIVSGAAKCWGSNFQGQVGGGVGPDVPTPRVVIASGVTAISNGQFHSCAVVSGAVQCWGDNQLGQLGDGTTTRRDSPVTVVAEGATAVVAGYFHTCAIVHGALQCWGGYKMKASYPNDYLHPVTVLPKVDDVALAGETIRALVNGAVLCSGVGCHPFQAISFYLPQTIAAGVPLSLGAQSYNLKSSLENNPLPIRFASSTPTVCSVSGNILTPLVSGTCTITADQDGDATYQRASTVTRNTNVTGSALLPQTISFTLPSPLRLKTPVTLNATASSTLTPIFVSNTPTVCRIDNTTLTPLMQGLCSVSVNQPGNTRYSAAPTVTQSASVLRLTQSISFRMPATLLPYTPVKLTATASSGLPVAYASTTPTVCTLLGDVLTAKAAGLCTVTATQGGNNTYSPAPAVSGSVTVAAATQTISFSLPLATPIGTRVALTAKATSGLSVSFASTTPKICTVSGNTLTPLVPGLCTITASQQGNAAYAAAKPVQSSTTVHYPVLVKVGFIAKSTIPGQAATATANVTGATSGGSVTFYVDGSAVCSNVVLVKNAASCKLRKYPNGSHTVMVRYTNGKVSASGQAILIVTKA